MTYCNDCKYLKKKWNEQHNEQWYYCTHPDKYTKTIIDYGFNCSLKESI
jgi:hypothetical protein